MAIRSLALRDLGVVAGGDFHGPGLVIMAFQRISTSALDAVTGGKLDLPSSTIDPNACSSSNPNGERTYTQAIATANTGPSLNDRVEASYNKAMAPWTTMNGLLSGVAGMGAAAMSTARAGR